jgi:protein involved in polysaccharide export with SLBB domain
LITSLARDPAACRERTLWGRIQKKAHFADLSNSNRKVLASGDIVKVTVLQEPDLEQEREIPESGEVDFLLIGKVPLAGLTPEAATEKGKALYDQDFLRNPYLRLTVVRPGVSGAKSGDALMEVTD